MGKKGGKGGQLIALFLATFLATLIKKHPDPPEINCYKNNLILLQSMQTI